MNYVNTKKYAGLMFVSLWLASASWGQSALPVMEESSEYFTAEKLISWVWQQNPGISELTAAAEVAVHRIESAGSLDDPTFGYAFAPRTFGREGQGLNQKIEFSQKLPWPGTLSTRKSVAAHNAEMAHRDIESLRLELAAKAKSAYAEWYFIQRALAIHHRTRLLLGELRSVAETRYAAGKALRQDALQAAVEETNLERHLLQLKRIETSVKAQINALLNRRTTASLPLPVYIPNSGTVPSLADLESDALVIHPELRRVDSQIAVHSSEVVLAKKAFYPDLRFTAGYNSLWDEPDKRPTVGLSINIPFDRSKRKAELRSAQANIRRAQSQRENMRAQLMGELATAYAAMVESVEAVALYENELLPLANEYFDAALADYESGAGSFLSVITAERSKLATEEALERNRADLLRHQATLERWAGRTLTQSIPELIREQRQGRSGEQS
jgi:outer membrane protein TolC